MKRSTLKRLKSIARQAGNDAILELTGAQDIAYKRFLIAQENCTSKYWTVYDTKLASLIADAEKAENNEKH